ncbi:hypothetical protein GCM10009117_02310 [Gangjinia marincola]|uniref:Uncharacterized protein n=1 Tax=Gangjinia marincola TaxID=578463 RepID=A0ABN1MDE5_9FLAO
MKPYAASFINAVVLIILGCAGYFSSATPSMTALIPVGVGIVLLILNKGVKNQNPVIAHIAVLLTFLMIVRLMMPLLGALERDDFTAALRVSVMLLFTAIAMITFIRSFIENRKARKNQ